MSEINFSNAAWLIFAAWGVAMLVLWNMHRHADFLSRKGYFATMIVLAFLLFFALWAEKRFGPDALPFQRVAIFAFPQIGGDAAILDANSIAVPYLAGTLLETQRSKSFRVVPLDWLFEAANHDSLLDEDYLQRCARRIGFEYMVTGTLRQDNDTTICTFRLLSRSDREPVPANEVRAPSGEPAVLAGAIAGRIWREFEPGPFAAPQAVPVPSPKLFGAYLDLLRGRVQEAGKLAEEFLARDSLDAMAAALAAKALFREIAGQIDAAGAMPDHPDVVTGRLAGFSDRDTTDAEMARLAAEGYLYRKKFNDAAYYLQRSLRHDDFNSKAYLLLSRLHFSRFRALGFENEIEILQQALRLNPGDVQCYLELAATYVKLDQTIKAQQALEKALALNPLNPEILNALGEIYVMRGVTEKVFLTYEKILDLQPDNANAFYNLGIYYYNADDHETATRFFKRAIKLNDHANSRLYLAKIAEKQGRMDEAIAYLRERIRLRRGEDDVYAEEARSHLFELMLSSGKIDSTGHLISNE